IAALLIDRGADYESVDNLGRDVLVTAVWRNRIHLVKLLLNKGAKVDRVDRRERNIFHHIAGDSDRGLQADTSTGEEILRLLLAEAGPKHLEAQDARLRTPLHWAAATGNCFVAAALLKDRNVNVNAVDHNGRSALHLAVRWVNVLLEHGAKIGAEADGGFTPFHTACADQPNPAVLDLLLRGRDEAHRRTILRRKTLSGRSALHLACEVGNTRVIEYLLADPAVITTTRDNFGNSPLLSAAFSKHRNVVELLAPYKQAHIDRLGEAAKAAAQQFNATIINFGEYKRGNEVDKRKSVFDVLYSNPREVKNGDAGVSTVCRKGDSTRFRWIHLPVNNVAWCQELLTKRFIEEGAKDVEAFKAVERSFMHQHRGQRFHSSYMRPMCQSIGRTVQASPPADTTSVNEHALSPSTDTNERARQRLTLRTDVEIVETQPSPSSGTAAEDNFISPEAVVPGATVSDGRLPYPRRHSTSSINRGGLLAPPEEADGIRPVQRSSTLESWDEREPPERHRPKERPVLHQRKRRGSSASKSKVEMDDLSSVAEHNVFLFAPYLHFEFDDERKEMQKAIEDAGMSNGHSRPTAIAFQEVLPSPEELLIRAHLHDQLHIRRTLDQSFFRNIDTSVRDADQVIYRYEKELMKQGGGNEKLKVLMVDQLWMWVVGKDLLITSFPRRWRQTRKDHPLNVLEGIIEEINANTGENVRNIYELAVLIAGRCFGAFDCSGVREDGSKFLDMFESSIGLAMDQETKLFAEFKHASQEVSDFLLSRHEQQSAQAKAHSKRARKLSSSKLPRNAKELSPGQEPEEIHTLMEIGAETKLLSDVKDIRDELDMLKIVFQQQQQVLPQVLDTMEGIFGDNPMIKAQRAKVERRLQINERAVSHHVNEIKRMDKQAERVYLSIRDLLDLKQKHANASEARYARYEAAETAHQGQILMVFTIVTVIFLPLSFIATFFALDITEFPHQGSDQQLPMGYVLKYLLGIGLSFAVLCVIAALSFDKIARLLKTNW
ncbi:hypothetical protein BAUCODRAFT_42293, partial [Baudoinia panamericana UAMH 10762]